MQAQLKALDELKDFEIGCLVFKIICPLGLSLMLPSSLLFIDAQLPYSLCRARNFVEILAMDNQNRESLLDIDEGDHQRSIEKLLSEVSIIQRR